jgi:hypothetical protein
MLKKIVFTLFLLCFLTNFAQNAIVLKGKIIDQNTSMPLESATIYLKSVKDSVVVDYTISDKKGDFEIKTKKNDKAVFFKIAYIGYADYSEKLDNLSTDKDFGFIKLSENINTLNEVVVASEIPPITIKKDTLEFNAASFKVGPDANVEALLKQLPGVEIDEEGRITVNGKEVNNILVNGKPFFGKDGKIATQNLPSDIIDKVQVTDTKTKEEELAGKAASSNEKTINLTIQKDKNKGLFGKATAGYGTDERYESSLLVNYFKDTQKISVLGASNNINAVGFSMDEIFDNMGGGRNTSIWASDSGGFGINGLSFGTNKGLTKSNMLGVNFIDEWAKKKFNPNGSYYFSNANTTNKIRSNRINLLSTGNTTTIDEKNTKSDSNGHNISMDFEIKIDSTFTININPSFNSNKTVNFTKGTEETFDENNAILNQNTTNNSWNNDTKEFKNKLFFYKRLKRKGRGISATIDNENSENNSDLYTATSTRFFQSGNLDDDRNQYRNENEKIDGFNLELGYTEPITDSLDLNFSTEYKFQKTHQQTATFDFNAVTNSFTNYNGLLSNGITSSNTRIIPTIGLNSRKEKFSAEISVGAAIINFDNQSMYLSNKERVNKNYIYPKVYGNMNVTLGKNKSIYTNASYEVDLPSPRQVLPFEDLTNPLNTLIGNSNLKPNEKISVYATFMNFDFATRSGLYTYYGLDYTKNEVVSSTIYDSDFKAVTTFENIDKAFSTYIGFSFNKSYKKEKRTFKYTFSIDIDYAFDQGLTNAALYESNRLKIRPKAVFSWSIDDLITINPSYKYIYITNDYSNYILDNTKNHLHTAKVEITSYWPKKVVFGSDFGYNYNSDIADGFQKDFYLWNLSLGYNFFNEKLLAKVKVYDVLNQNISNTRTISPTAITDLENTVLQQYAMFSLTYKLEKFKGKNKESSGVIVLD